jgi:microcystin-dependent protein
MSSPFVAEIRPWAINFAPRGWAMAQGQILPISQYTALFSLIGTYYGGNGTSNFQLPDLRSRVPMKFGSDPVGNQYVIGQEAGEETVTIQSNQMPIHTHNVFGSNAATGNFAFPAAGTALASNDKGNAFYAPSNSPATAINPGTVSTYAGGNQPHTNLQPYLAINWCIALVGIYPSRN